MAWRLFNAPMFSEKIRDGKPVKPSRPDRAGRVATGGAGLQAALVGKRATQVILLDPHDLLRVDYGATSVELLDKYQALHSREVGEVEPGGDPVSVSKHNHAEALVFGHASFPLSVAGVRPEHKRGSTEHGAFRALSRMQRRPIPPYVGGPPAGDPLPRGRFSRGLSSSYPMRPRFSVSIYARTVPEAVIPDGKGT